MDEMEADKEDASGVMNEILIWEKRSVKTTMKVTRDLCPHQQGGLGGLTHRVQHGLP